MPCSLAKAGTSSRKGCSALRPAVTRYASAPGPASSQRCPRGRIEKRIAQRRERIMPAPRPRCCKPEGTGTVISDSPSSWLAGQATRMWTERMPRSGSGNGCRRGASTAMRWYDGPSLLELLESLPTSQDTRNAPFRFPVQRVLRPDHTFRGFAGQIASGTVRPGDTITVLPSGRSAEVERIVPRLAGRGEQVWHFSVCGTRQQRRGREARKDVASADVGRHASSFVT